MKPAGRKALSMGARKFLPMNLPEDLGRTKIGESESLSAPNLWETNWFKGSRREFLFRGGRPMNLRWDRGTLAVGRRGFPSPQPSPQGRGRSVASLLAWPTRPTGSRDRRSGPLYPEERAGVRGKGVSHRAASWTGSGAHGAKKIRSGLSAVPALAGACREHDGALCLRQSFTHR